MFNRDRNDSLIEWCASGLHTRESAIQTPSQPKLGLSEACLVTACQGYLLSFDNCQPTKIMATAGI